jgi:hypothetical protein
VLIKLNDGEFAQIGATFDLVFTVGSLAQTTITVTKAGSFALTYDAIRDALNDATSPVTAAEAVDPSGAESEAVLVTSKFAGTGTVSVACNDGRIKFHPVGEVNEDNISTISMDFTAGADLTAAVLSVTAAQDGKVKVTINSTTHNNATGISGLTDSNSYKVRVEGLVLGVSALEYLGHNDSTYGSDFTGTTTLIATTTKTFSGPVTVTVTQGSTGAYVADASVDIGYSWTHSEVTYASEIVDVVNALPDEAADKGYSAAIVSPQAAAVSAVDLDLLSGTAIFAGSTHVYAKTWHTYNELLKSALITPTLPTPIASSGGGAIVDVAKNFLKGGAKGTASTADWTTALNVMRDPKYAVEIIVPVSTILSVHKAVRSHCQYMAGLGRHECLAWCGAPSQINLGNVSTGSTLAYHTAQLNSRFLALAFQDIYVADAEGNSKWLTPEYTAVMLAAMQASSPVATPLTRKVPNILDLRQAVSVTLMDDIEMLLKKALVTIMPTANGWWIERGVTTYQLTNMVYNEMSANESVNTSIRDLRNHLTLMIGTKNVAATQQNIKSLVETRLQKQVETDIIKAFDPASIEAVDLGDTYNVTYTAAPAFPLNFIKLEAVFVAAI